MDTEAIQAIVDRTGLSPVQAAAIAAQEREAAIQPGRADAGRHETSTELEPLTATDLPTISSRRFFARPASAPVQPTAAPKPICPQCDGAGYYKEAVPFDHPHFGVLLPCACKVREIAEKDARILRDLADELQRYRHCRLADYGLKRPIPKPLTWNGVTLTVKEQRAALVAAHASACAYVKAPVGWLYLYGPPGSGKTRLAACIANELAQQMRVSYATTPGLIGYIQAGFSDDTAHRRRLALQRVPALILDDLGTEHITDFSRAELGDLLNQRYNRELPTIITNNDWFEALPVRIADRIAEMAQIIYLTVSSYRRLGSEAPQ